ncbi:MAG TPA: MarC family protein [bacterium]|jgi:multiple antibiotic resistance protein|nr:MarC family protein [bacterium]
MTWTDFLSLFLPLFVAMDPLGILPAFIQMTSDLSVKRRQRVLNGSILLAGLVGILFIPLGPRILLALGLKVGDFQIAGGLLVLVIALRDIVWEQKMFAMEESSDDSVGIVPIGIPLLVGPGVLATLILLRHRFVFWEIASSLALNLLIAWIIFRNASYLMQIMGVTGTKAVSKLAALLLSAYAVMMIRVALVSIK